MRKGAPSRKTVSAHAGDAPSRSLMRPPTRPRLGVTSPRRAASTFQVRAKPSYGLRVCEIYDKVILAQVEDREAKKELVILEE